MLISISIQTRKLKINKCNLVIISNFKTIPKEICVFKDTNDNQCEIQNGIGY